MINFSVNIKVFCSKFFDNKQFILNFILSYVNKNQNERGIKCYR